VGKKMKTNVLLAACVFLAIMIVTSGAYACSISISNSVTEVRSDATGYDIEISAQNASPIDIRNSFTVTSISGTDCSSTIQTQAKVYRYNDNNGGWDLIDTAASQSRTLSNDDYIFTWPHEFTASNVDKKYKVEGLIIDGNRILDTRAAYVYMGLGECTGIELITKTINVDEGSDSSEIFKIKNNTDTDFRADGIDVSLASSMIRSGHVFYDSFNVDSGETLEVEVDVEAAEVNSDSTVTGTFRVSGYLGNTYCTYSDIGQKSFNVNIKDLGDETGPSADCGNITVNTNDFAVNEGESTIQTFYVQNDSERKFEITRIRLSDNGTDLSDYYYDPVIRSGEVGDVLVKADASTNVNYDQTFSNTIEVEGQFSNGKKCSFFSLGLNSFKVTVKDLGFGIPENQSIRPLSSYAGYETGKPTQTYFSQSDCENFSISAINEVSAYGNGKVPVTIKNNTGKRVSITIESNAKTNPSQISVPEYTYITRDISFEMKTKEGEIKLIPQMDGCVIGSTTISIHNDSNNFGGNSGNTATPNGTFAGLAGLFSSGLPLLAGAILVILIIAAILFLLGRGYSDVSENLTFELTSEELNQLRKWEQCGGKTSV
jgi:hypothetical protein